MLFSVFAFILCLLPLLSFGKTGIWGRQGLGMCERRREEEKHAWLFKKKREKKAGMVISYKEGRRRREGNILSGTFGEGTCFSLLLEGQTGGGRQVKIGQDNETVAGKNFSLPLLLSLPVSSLLCLFSTTITMPCTSYTMLSFSLSPALCLYLLSPNHAIPKGETLTTCIYTHLLHCFPRTLCNMGFWGFGFV